MTSSTPEKAYASSPFAPDASSQNEIDIVATDGGTRVLVAEWGQVDWS